MGDSKGPWHESNHCLGSLTGCCVRKARGCVCECVKCINARAMEILSQPPPRRVPEEKAELHPCDYCGTMLDEYDCVESDIPAVNGPTLHSASQCREYVYTVLRGTKRDLDASRAANAEMRRALPDDLRADGWAVAAHNDYRQAGEPHTFWLLVRGNVCVKGEGKSDAEALGAIRVALRAVERPNCSGKWVGGSGGHRQHEACGKPADWWHPDDTYAYCDEHMGERDERTQYRRWRTAEEAPEAREPARLDADRTAQPRTVLVAHANVEPGAMVAHDNEIERYELRDTGEPAPAADMPELVLRVEPNDDATLTCILCSYERPTELCTTYLSTHGTTTSGMHRSCYERARQKRSGAPPAAEGLTAEEWGVWNLTYGRWVGRESWHATREAAQRECDAWNRANGCEYEPRVRAAAEKAGGR